MRFPFRRQRLTRAFDPQGTARVLNEHDNYRVLRRLKPHPVDLAYRLSPDESITLVVDVETPGFDQRRDEVIELGMVAFVHEAERRIGPVVACSACCRSPRSRSAPRSPA